MKKFLSALLAVCVIAASLGFSNLSAAALNEKTGAYCDVTGDGLSDSSDALKILQNTVNIVTFTDDEIAAADKNGDSKADSADALLVLQFCVNNVQLVSGGNTKYRVVIADSDDSSFLATVRSFRVFVKSNTGAILKLENDNTQSADDFEIVIGLTSREESVEIRKGLSNTDFEIKLDGNRLYVVGGTVEATSRALNYITENFIKDGYFAMPSEFVYQFKLDFPDVKSDSITVDGTDISNYTIVPANTSDEVVSAVNMLKSRVESVCGAKLKTAESDENLEHTIYVGCNSLPEGMIRGDVKLSFGQDIELVAENSKITDTVKYFCRDFLSAGRVSGGTLVITALDSYCGDLFINPTTQYSYPDPFVKYIDDGYYYSMGTVGNNLTLCRSRNLSTLTNDESRVLYNAGENVIAGNIWAPEFWHDEETGKWYIYACGALDLNDGYSERVFCLESNGTELWGDYTFKAVINPDECCIDPSVMKIDSQGKLFMTYTAVGGGENRIAVGEMINPWTMDTTTGTVISGAKYEWEKYVGRINEGGCFIENNGKLYLAYSANDASTKYYAVGLLEFTGDYKSENLADAEKWVKHEEPLLKPGNWIYCTGHNSFFMSPDGTEMWIAYHGRIDDIDKTWERPLCLQKLEFDENGDFVFNQVPAISGTFITEPSGTNN